MVLLLAGCGSRGRGEASGGASDASADSVASGACWGRTQPLADPRTTEERACDAIIRSDIANLEGIFRPYATGSIAGYEGSVVAYDNRDILPGYQKETLKGECIAQLVRSSGDGSASPAWKLQITVPGAKRWIQVIQYDVDPDTLEVSDISEYCCSEGGRPATVPANGVRLAAGDPTLALELDASGGAWGADEPKSIHLTANLSRIAGNAVPATWVLEFDHGGAWGFAVEGGEIVRHLANWDMSFTTETPPQMKGWVCAWSTSYSLDQWVNIADPSQYGVRNVVLHSAQFCCSTDCVAEHCAKTVCCAESSACVPE